MTKTKVRLAAVVVASLGTLVAGAASPAMASPTPNEGPGASLTLRLQNLHSGKCLSVSGASTANSAGIVQVPCAVDSAQQWTLAYQSNPGDIATFKNFHSGKCIALPGASTTEGATVIQYTCNGNTDQAWHARNTDMPVTNVHSGKCLAIKGASTANSAPAVQTTCNGKSEQTWVFLGEA